MKDGYARDRAVSLERRVNDLATEVATLRAAYDELFDFLAGELGFRATMAYSPYWYEGHRASPRRFEKTVPPAPQIVREKKKK